LTTTNLDIGQFDLVTAFRFLGNADDQLRRSAMDALRVRIDGYLLINNHRNPVAVSDKWQLEPLLLSDVGKHAGLDYQNIVCAARWSKKHSPGDLLINSRLLVKSTQNKSASSNHYFSLYRDSQQSVEKWREAFTSAQLHRIHTVVSRFPIGRLYQDKWS
jgi:hypothetical protein